MATTTAVGSEEHPPGSSEIQVVELMIAMRDGVQLATDLYSPVSPRDKIPILLNRTPYNKRNQPLVQLAGYFASHGYVVAVQDCRGRYSSEGRFTKYFNEAEDGYDTLEYLAKLPAGDGQIGMWGSSYSAHVQAAAASLNPHGLKAMILNMGGVADGWENSLRNHGAFELKQLVWAFQQAVEDNGALAKRGDLSEKGVLDWLSAWPFRRGLSPLAAAPDIERYFFRLATESDYTSYWQARGLNWKRYYQETADVPVMLLSGWYDAYCQSTFDNYLGLAQLKKSPIRLVMGPWVHGGIMRSYAGEVEFGQDAALPDFAWDFHLRWFDTYLKGSAKEPANPPPIRLFVMGTGDGHKDGNGRLYHGGYWMEPGSWPLPHTDFLNYYLHADGSLRSTAPTEPAAVSYLFDPRHPVPTIGASSASSQPAFASGAFDQRERPFNGNPEQGFFGSQAPYLPLKARPDVLVFQSDPLTADLRVIGPIRVTLSASSSATDTDFTAKLIDVYPPSSDYPQGFEMNLTDGIIRARYRASRSQGELLVPGQVYPFVIEPFPTANVFKKGHRIRLDISSSNFPRFDVNPNTGEPLGQNRLTITAQNTVYLGGSQLSYIELPVVLGLLI